MRLFACALLLSGCTLFGGGHDECGVILPEDVVLVASDQNSVISDLQDGGEVALIAAPQGGHILLVGARVHTAHDCEVAAAATLRDPTTQTVIGVDHQALMLEVGSDGWAVPGQGLLAMPNVPVCPSSAATKSIDGNPYLLEVALSTFDGAPLVTSTITVTPTCSSTYCHTECSPTP